MAHQGHFCIASSIKTQRSSARMKERLTRLPTETRLMIGEIGTRPLFPRIASFFSLSPPSNINIDCVAAFLSARSRTKGWIEENTKKKEETKNGKKGSETFFLHSYKPVAR